MSEPIPFEPWRVASIEERRIADVLGVLAHEKLEWAGGVAACSEPGSWLNQVIGAGDGVAVSEADVEDVARWYEARGVEPKIVIHPYVHTSLTSALGAAGFRLKTAEIVIGAELDGTSREAVPAPPEGVTIDVLDKNDAQAVEEVVQMCARCFRPDVEPPDPHLVDSTRRSIHHPRAIMLVAKVDGQLAAAGGFEQFENLAALYGAATAKPFRGRGIQQALIYKRLDVARERGAKWALVTSLPRTGTERNALRCGMRQFYTRLEFVRPGEGLVASP
ncbi:MAG: GNAT family N-acetyltransferase [Phycisphaerales bacterium]|nr:GNAT family N-acetyltransferase [Phycisphaerales bacterium]